MVVVIAQDKEILFLKHCKHIFFEQLSFNLVLTFDVPKIGIAMSKLTAPVWNRAVL